MLYILRLQVLLMTTPTTTYSIKLLNKVYEIKCPEDEVVNLQAAAEKLTEQLTLNKKNFKQLDDFQNLMLAALHVSRDLVTCQKQQEQQRHQVSQFIDSLETKINQVVNGVSFKDKEVQTD
jgi:cell division protein ZapA